MSYLYVAGELGAEKCRILLGALQKEGLMVSEAGEFQDVIAVDGDTVQWDISQIYHQILASVHGIVAQEVPIRGISFHSAVTDCLLFEDDGSMMAPATRHSEEARNAAWKKLLSKLPPETLYEETGVQPSPNSMLCQLAVEPSRRLKRASHVLSLADGFNYFFSGIPRAEVSQAHLTQLYNPVNKAWVERFFKPSGIPAKLMPPVVPSGTMLSQVRKDIAHEAGLEDARVVATCSQGLSAALAALTLADPENWAFIRPDDWTILGTRLEAPFINDVSREMQFSNLVGYGGSTALYKAWTGLRLVDECHRAWSQQDRALDGEVLMHLATSAAPFEAFIDPADPRFLEATDMPQTIQGFCRETGQEAPRKPGPILRCVLESLALQYRKALLELEYVTGVNFSRIYVLGGKSNVLLHHFLANALQIPVLAVPTSVAALGNVALQALALKHIASPEEARGLVNRALRAHTINPHANAWTEAYDRFLALRSSQPESPQA
jgi:rhamnulokinase